MDYLTKTLQLKPAGALHLLLRLPLPYQLSSGGVALQSARPVRELQKQLRSLGDEAKSKLCSSFEKVIEGDEETAQLLLRPLKVQDASSSDPNHTVADDSLCRLLLSNDAFQEHVIRCLLAKLPEVNGDEEEKDNGAEQQVEQGENLTLLSLGCP